MPRAGVHLWPKMRGHFWRETSEIFATVQRINDESAFLAKLAAAAPAAWRRGRGRPRNITAYFVMNDIAAIYEWVTKMEATREVDRVSNKDSGPFWQFATTIWCVVFGGTTGLSAAMKNWAGYRRKYGERSALMANLAIRNRAWRLFEM
jgi:hypothetical protein